MLTILTSFKPFRSDDAIRQRNALASWRALGADIEIIAFGETEGLFPAAEAFRVQVMTDIPCYEHRLPRIDAIFDYAQTHGTYDLQVYLNGDILLFQDFVQAFGAIHLPRFVMVGQRIDVEVKEPLDFSDPPKMRREFINTGRIHDVGGIDYFAYRRGSMPVLPPLYLGAAGWDNIVIYTCRRARIPVVDATRDVAVFHQNHDYPRLSNGQPAAYAGPAARSNLEQVEDQAALFYTTDASYWLDQGKLRSALRSPRHAWRLILTYPLLRGWQKPFRWPFRLAAAVIRRLGVIWIKVFAREDVWRHGRE